MNAAANKSKPEANPEIRIIKIDTCPNLSGKSSLTYHIGCNTESELFFRV